SRARAGARPGAGSRRRRRRERAAGRVRAPHPRGRMSPAQYGRCMGGIIRREGLRWVHQRGRFISALVRPLVWLAIFAAGFRFVLGVSIMRPYDTYVPYEVYIAPGL